MTVRRCFVMCVFVLVVAICFQVADAKQRGNEEGSSNKGKSSSKGGPSNKGKSSSKGGPSNKGKSSGKGGSSNKGKSSSKGGSSNKGKSSSKGGSSSDRRSTAEPRRQDVSPSKNLVRELNMSQLQFRDTNGKIDYCQAIVNKELPGEMSLVLILHGKSGCGDDNVRQLASPALKPLLSFVKTHAKKCVVLVPQCPSGRDWVGGDSGTPLISVVSELVKRKCKEFDVPPNRTYITGISMGGGACYTLAAKESQLFARAVVVSAGGRPNDASKIRCDVYIVHGDQDRTIPVDRARTMADAIRKNGKSAVQFTILPNKDHIETAHQAYSEKCWRWLFQVNDRPLKKSAK